MILFDIPDPPTIDPPPARVDEYQPRRNIRVDTTFWQHRSIFAGSQEQLNQLRREADARAAARARARQSIHDVHRPAIRRLKPIVHVGLVPMLWAITTCKCGDRWPCNSIKQYLRHRLGWTADITEPLNELTKRLPKPTTRLSRLRQSFNRFRRHRDESGSRRDRDT